jgi:hypothetical protein
MTGLENWYVPVGDEERRNWSGNSYRFITGKEEREDLPLLEAIQHDTPLRNFIDQAAEDNVIRAISFMSYYLVNPTFDNSSQDSNFFWFPLDELTQRKYDELERKIDDENEDNSEDERQENEEEEEDGGIFSDFPFMKRLSKPILEAALSDRYIKRSRNKDKKDREEILEKVAEEKKKEKLEEFEEWLEDGMGEDVGDEFPMITDAFSRMPSYLLLNIIKDEDERAYAVHDVLSRVRVPDSSAKEQMLMEKLTSLVEDTRALNNPAVEGFCLDENNRDCEFHVTKNRALNIDHLDKCDRCGSRLYRIFRSGINEKVRLCWFAGLLPELVTARSLQKADWVNETIPHKKVQMEDDGPTEAIEIDVTVHTEDDDILFFEVTSQRDYAVGRVNRKRKKIEDAGVEYDGLVQVSLAENPEIIPFTDGVVVVPPQYIPRLESRGFKEELMDNL